MLVLAIGDLHIPLRKADLPPKFKACPLLALSAVNHPAHASHGPASRQALLMPGKIQHVLSPGDLCVKACVWHERSDKGTSPNASACALHRKFRTT